MSDVFNVDDLKRLACRPVDRAIYPVFVPDWLAQEAIAAGYSPDRFAVSGQLPPFARTSPTATTEGVRRVLQELWGTQ